MNSDALTPGAECASEELLAARADLAAFFRNRWSERGAVGADDLVQETLLAAWRAIVERQAPGARRFRAYVWGIARNKMRDAVRARVLERRRSDPIADAGEAAREAGAPPAAPAVIERLEGARRLQDVLARCRPLERRLLILRIVLGMSHHEACSTAGVDPVRGSRIVYRAVERLRRGDARVRSVR